MSKKPITQGQQLMATKFQQSPVNLVNNPLSIINTIPVINDVEHKNWKESLYGVSDIPDDIIKSLVEMFSYKGFNRDDVLKQLHQFAGDNKRIIIDLIVSTALRGPQAASHLKMSNGKTPIEMGIPASGGKGSKNLTLNKIQASTADLAAYYLKRMDAPKRINIALPGWLQFPSAGSIKLPKELRDQHVDFSKRFSSMIGGNFQEQIYNQMEVNAYLDERLMLFNQ